MTEEQREGLKQIRERQKWRANASIQNGRTPESNNTYADIDFLLSLLDSQAAVNKRPAGWISAKVSFDNPAVVRVAFESPGCAKAFVDDIEPVVTATAMRDACVEKVKAAAKVHREMAEKFKSKAIGEMQLIRAEECEELAELLQSLTLDQVRQEKQL